MQLAPSRDGTAAVAARPGVLRCPMARRRTGDRVVGRPATGGSLLFDPSVSLPRSTYRDIEALSSTLRREEYGSPTPRVAGNVPRSLVAHFPRRYGLRVVVAPPPPLAPRRGRGGSRWSWLPVLNRIPSRVLFCVKRKRRRETLFALKKVGFRGSSPKKHYRRNANSNYGC